MTISKPSAILRLQISYHYSIIFQSHFRKCCCQLWGMVWAHKVALFLCVIVTNLLPCPAVRASSSSRALLMDSAAATAYPAPFVGPASACGTVGSPCCPSALNNTNSWRCKDNSTCVYFQLGDNSKLSKCEAIDRTCGTGPNTPCCPARYERGVMFCPDLAPGNAGCPTGTFCDKVDAKSVCVPQPKECGKFGQKCCVTTSRLGPYFECKGSDGSRGYCENPPGYTGTEDGPLRELVCTKCPDKLDENNPRTVRAQGARCKD